MAEQDNGFFGLMTSEQLRRSRLVAEQEAQKTRAALPGQMYASAAFGNALGGFIRNSLIKSGKMEDPEMKKADAISNAVENARKAVAPDGDVGLTSSDDLYGSKIKQGQVLINQLEVQGYSDEADQVRSRLIALQEMQAKDKQLKTQTRATEAGAVAQEDLNKFGESVTIQRLGPHQEALTSPFNAQVHSDGSATYRENGVDKVLMPGEFRKATLTGGEAELSADMTTLRDVEGQLRAANSTVTQLTKFRDLLIDNPTALSQGNAAAAFLNRMGTEAKAVLPRNLGAAVEAKLQSYFQTAGIADGRARAMLTSVAYAAASGTNRVVTDKDLDAYKQIIGGEGGQDLNVRIAILDDVIEQTKANIDFAVQTPGAEAIRSNPMYTDSFNKVTWDAYLKSRDRFAPKKTIGSPNAYNQSGDRPLSEILGETASSLDKTLSGTGPQ